MTDIIIKEDLKMKKFIVLQNFNDSKNNLKEVKKNSIIENLSIERENELKGNNKHGIVYIADYKEPKSKANNKED